MINNSEFSKRLKEVLEYYQLSASAFAEKINVQRSSISHLLSGRNKPSLDFVLKVLQTFDEVELYWLLNGKGTFPKKEKKLTYASSLFPEEQKKLSNIEENDNTETSNLPIDSLITSNNKSNIEKIVIFYKNGTFKLYNEQ
jgi:transcriptional regulator with XRE-family HTH domain